MAGFVVADDLVEQASNNEYREQTARMSPEEAMSAARVEIKTAEKEKLKELIRQRVGPAGLPSQPSGLRAPNGVAGSKSLSRALSLPLAAGLAPCRRSVAASYIQWRSPRVVQSTHPAGRGMATAESRLEQHRAI